jgi:hypothetical protein
MRAISSPLPPRIALDGLRHALFKGHGWVGDAGLLVLCAAVGLPLAVYLFGAAIRSATRRGTLTRR